MQSFPYRILSWPSTAFWMKPKLLPLPTRLSMIVPWPFHQPHLCFDPTSFLSVLQTPALSSLRDLMKHNVPATACSGSLPHANSFYTIAHSVCIELMNVCPLFPVAPVASCGQRAYPSCVLLSLGHSGYSLNTQWMTSVVIPPGLTINCCHHCIPSPPRIPPRWAANLVAGNE